MEQFLINEIIESDSDSDFLYSESEESEIEIMRTNRNCIKEYFESVVPKYSDKEFLRHFRITKELFGQLTEEFENSDIYKDLDSNQCIPADKHIALFLWFAGHEACSFRDLADRFDLSLSTVHSIINRSIVFFSAMSQKVITWPSKEDQEETVNYFLTKKHFPGIIGAIDGTKIIIDPPGLQKDDYIDRKGNYSITVQAVCDENHQFTDIYIGFPGSAHDCRVFQNSELSPKLPRICENGFYLLGDSAYQCTQFLLTPFRDNGHLSAAEKNYNFILSSCRVIIEHAFGILKQRFRQLYYCKLKGIKKLCHFIRACMVLHNLSNTTDFDFDLVAEDDGDDDVSTIADTKIGNALRRDVCNALFTSKNKKRKIV